MSHELNTAHQEIADAARAKVMELISRSTLALAEVAVIEVEQEGSVI